MRELVGWLAEQEARDLVDEATAALQKRGLARCGRPASRSSCSPWNGRDDTLGCLASLRGVEHEPLDVIVVDNGSDDGTAEAVRERFPEVELVRSEENLGFAEGNDVGIRHALERGADHVLVLNNDVEVEPGFVGALVEEAGRRPDAGALCSKILYFEPRDRIWFAGASFDPRRGYTAATSATASRTTRPRRSRGETGRACGAAMPVPRAALERVGDFDPKLFVYVEDIDWSLRARDAGLTHCVVPREPGLPQGLGDLRRREHADAPLLRHAQHARRLRAARAARPCRRRGGGGRSSSPRTSRRR